MRVYTLKMETTGAPGAATGSDRRGVPYGILRAVQVLYNGQPATTDVTLTCVLDGVTKTILTLTNKNTNFPLQSVYEAGKDNLGVSVVAGKNAELVLPLVGGELVGEVADGDANTDGVKILCLVDQQ